MRAIKIIIACLALAGCSLFPAQAVKDARVAARAGVVGVAGATRGLTVLCTETVSASVANIDKLSLAQVQDVLRVANACAAAADTAGPLLENAALVLDKWNGSETTSASDVLVVTCNVARTVASLHVAANVLVSHGVKLPEALVSELQIGDIASEACAQ